MQAILQEHISERLPEQNSYVPAPPNQKEIAEVMTLTPQERTFERVIEQHVVFLDR